MRLAAIARRASIVRDGLAFDDILTGTPAGVGLGRDSPSYLVPGDRIVTIVGDQTLQNTATPIRALEAS